MFLFNLLLAIAWVAVTGDLSFLNLVIGFVLGYAVLWLVASDQRRSYFERTRRQVGFAFYFIWELLKANAKVAFDVATPHDYMRPAVLAIPVASKSDNEIALLANAITLTPGSLCLAISPDKKWMYVHAMYVSGDLESARRELVEGLGSRVEGVFE